jgi:predicted AAA+ superfamily ATPase
VGKTETASRRSRSEVRLDDPAVLELVLADPARVMDAAAPILIDEWQRHPPLWDLVRRAVDEGAAPGTYLLTGSSVPATAPVHSGAGRIVTVRMRPLSLAERGIERATVSLARLLDGDPTLEGSTAVGLGAYATEIVRSGFPGIRLRPDRARRSLLDGYLTRITERDFEEQGLRVRSPSTLRNWMTALAAATATTATHETIRDAATAGVGDKPARSTTLPYREVLEQLWIYDPVPGWRPTANRVARLTAPPKHHLVDPALAVRLLGLDATALLSPDQAVPAPGKSPLIGALFEALVTQSMRVYAQAAEAQVYHLRTASGDREVDLIVERSDGVVVAIEVKLAATVSDRDGDHLRWLRQRLGGELLDALIVTTGSHAYRRADGIGVVPAALLGP